MKKLSIITINLNNKEGLQKTMDSVFSQKFTDYEYIIMDGGSTDGGVELIKEFSDRITYWVSEPDKGIYNAMNKGIIKAKSEYLLFLNSGDCLVNNNIVSEVFALNLESDLILGNLVTNDNYEIKLNYNIDIANIWKYGAHHQAMFIKRSLFEQIGFYNENGDITADWQFLMQALFRFKKSFTCIDKIISVYDMQGISSKPENKKRINLEKKRFMKEKFEHHPLFVLQGIIFIRENYQRIKSIPSRVKRIATSITNNR
ncbi:MAG: glycosyltransferase family 2 protein [Bacteroidales bacterium]|nr:glycosyltransferase family 2 protein [Bacteroidales bacterium]